MKEILIACEESQAITKAFRELGYNAYSCDLLPSSGGHPEWHIKGDAIAEAYSGKYDMMIAHPPCTYISRAGARWMYPTAGNLSKERFDKAIEAKDFFIKLLYAPIPYIAVENPTPLMVVNLTKKSQNIQPYEYGHPYSKTTLPLPKNLPLLIQTKIVSDYKPYLPSNTGGKKRGQKYQFKNISQKESSKTFSGIAKAMAQQWSCVL